MTLIFLALSLVYSAKTNSLLVYFHDFYRDEQWRWPFMAVRIIAYRQFLFFITGALGLWCFVTIFHSSFTRLVQSVRVKKVISQTVAYSLVLICAWLAYFFSNREWLYFGQPCWDQYCDYSDLFFQFLFRPSPLARTELWSFMHTDYHANSPVGPMIVAVLKAMTGLSTVNAYRMACSLMSFGLIGLIPRLISILKVDTNLCFPIQMLLLTNFSWIRSSFFPQTDPFVLFWVTALLICAWARHEKPTTGLNLLCFLILLTGMFVKLSFLPALGLIPLWRIIDIARDQYRNRERLSNAELKSNLIRLVKEIGVFSIWPALCFLLIQRVLGMNALYHTELAQMSTVDSYWPLVVVSFLISSGIFLYLIAVGWIEFEKEDYFILGWLLLYLTGIWTSRASGWCRFYLPALPAFALLSAKGLQRIRRILGVFAMWAFISLAAFLNYSLLWLRIYN